MEDQVGVVTHYFGKISVAVLALDKKLQVGDSIHVLGHSTDFTQEIKSLEVEHEKIEVAEPGMDVALKVKSRVRKGDKVYIVEGD